jgi:PII-like signaling protein
MLTRGPARKVTVHLNEDTSSQQGFLYQQVLSLLLEKGVGGATVIRPEAGFGSHRHLHEKEGHGAQHRHLPIRIEFIESVDLVEALLPSLCDIVKDGLIDVHETTIVKIAKQETTF